MIWPRLKAGARLVIQTHLLKKCFYLSRKRKSSYFIFFAHVSQYFSMRVDPPPTSNIASWVATLPHVAQNFALPVWWSSVKDLSDVKIFSISILLFIHLVEIPMNLTNPDAASIKALEVFRNLMLLLFIAYYRCRTNKNLCLGIIYIRATNKNLKKP